MSRPRQLSELTIASVRYVKKTYPDSLKQAFVPAGAAVFWVIGASFFVIGLHASFYNFDAIDDLVADDKQQLTGNIVEEV